MSWIRTPDDDILIQIMLILQIIFCADAKQNPDWSCLPWDRIESMWSMWRLTRGNQSSTRWCWCWQSCLWLWQGDAGDNSLTIVDNPSTTILALNLDSFSPGHRSLEATCCWNPFSYMDSPTHSQHTGYRALGAACPWSWNPSHDSLSSWWQCHDINSQVILVILVILMINDWWYWWC